METVNDLINRNISAPFVAESETSVLAAAAARAFSSRQRAAVYDVIKKAGKHGLSDEEGSNMLGLNPSSFRPRRIELQRLGLVATYGLQRETKSGRMAMIFRSVPEASK